MYHHGFVNQFILMCSSFRLNVNSVRITRVVIDIGGRSLSMNMNENNHGDSVL